MKKLSEEKIELIVSLLQEGKSQNKIKEIVGCSKSTVSLWASRNGFGGGPRNKHNWGDIQVYYNEGHSYKECIKEFNIGLGSIFNARKSGRFKTRPVREEMSIEELLSKPRSSFHMKGRLIKAGVLENKCDECGLTEWRGKRLPLDIHHVDGEKENNKLENLRILCPNCHAQTETYRGKNVKIKKNKASIVQR